MIIIINIITRSPLLIKGSERENSYYCTWFHPENRDLFVYTQGRWRLLLVLVVGDKPLLRVSNVQCKYRAEGKAQRRLILQVCTSERREVKKKREIERERERERVSQAA
ncbi:hypothetical protein KIL84_003178 [Mauremys mutica]|uniref:Uncharacterized protein n=1 Tax=Mauremys mutica TaxID=74926 RepID=A0A9D3WVL6_9SAUR|nr:hypothetical protein KIL84_003178 [Mauremys mutica]